MTKYKVTLYYHSYATVTVNAKNEQDAVETARCHVTNEDINDNLIEDGSPDVEKACDDDEAVNKSPLETLADTVRRHGAARPNGSVIFFGDTVRAADRNIELVRVMNDGRILATIVDDSYGNPFEDTVTDDEATVLNGEIIRRASSGGNDGTEEREKVLAYLSATRAKTTHDLTELIMRYGDREKDGYRAVLKTFDLCSDYGLGLDGSTVDELRLHHDGNIDIVYNENINDWQSSDDVGVRKLSNFTGELTEALITRAVDETEKQAVGENGPDDDDGTEERQPLFSEEDIEGMHVGDNNMHIGMMHVEDEADLEKAKAYLRELNRKHLAGEPLTENPDAVPEYNQEFVEKHHPDYNCDDIAQLDDACCCRDNECDNITHWKMLAEEFCADEDERSRCLAICDGGEKPDHELGAALAKKYAKEIAATITRLEKKVMAEAYAARNREPKFRELKARLVKAMRKYGVTESENDGCTVLNVSGDDIFVGSSRVNGLRLSPNGRLEVVYDTENNDSEPVEYIGDILLSDFTNDLTDSLIFPDCGFPDMRAAKEE